MRATDKLKKNEHIIQIANFEEYFENVKIINSATLCYRRGVLFYIHNRKQIRKDEFEKMFPTDFKIQPPKNIYSVNKLNQNIIR